MHTEIEKVKLRFGKMPKAQKKRFLNFAIECLSNPDEYLPIQLAFCNIYRRYFGVDAVFFDDKYLIFNTIPEFLEFRPKDYFYEPNNILTNNPRMFWFKLNDGGIKKRLEICKKVLKQL